MSPSYWLLLVATLLILYLLARKTCRDGERFRLLVENTSDLVCLHDLDGYCVWVSPSCKRLLGYTAKELRGSKMCDHLHPDDEERVCRECPWACKSAFPGFQPSAGKSKRTARIRRKDGSYAWMEMLIYPVRNRRGRVIQVQTASRDVSERKQAEDLYRFLIRNLPDMAVFLFDSELRLVVAEGSILHRLIQRPDPERHRIWGALGRELADIIEPGCRDVFRGKSNSTEHPSQGRIYRIVTFPVYDTSGQISLGMAVAEDITIQRQTVAALREQSADLERSNRDLERFANVASHELKSPLRRIASFAELLADDYEGLLSDDADEYIGHIIDAVQSLKEVIEALLTYSRVQRDRTHMSWVCLADVCTEAVSNLGPLLRERGAQVTFDTGAQVTGDHILLRQLLENLIGNGIKFNPKPGPKVHVAITRGLLDWEVIVMDNGPGIAPEYHDKVFQMFQRLRPDVDGTGIGLALCKKIVGIHRGKIWVGKNGKGAQIHFTLPARTPDEVTQS
jgi:PAS domain S-box-containing protein